MINERCRAVVAQMRRSIAMLPGAMSAAIFESKAWTTITIFTVSADAVFSLALLLGLGEVKERKVKTEEGERRWFYARTEQRERGRGLLVVDVVGPSSDPAGTAGAGGTP